LSAKPRVPRPYLALFASLYALQGVTVAYLLNYNKKYMIDAGVDARTVALVQSAVLMTLVFKFLLGPLSDRVNLFGLGHRRPYIVLGLLLQSVGLVGLSLIHPSRDLGTYALMAVASVAGLALFDTCCDGMVVDVTPPDDRSRVQGTLMVSRFLATMFCTFGFGAWIDSTGLGPGRSDGVLWVCAGMGLIPLALAVAVREPSRASDAEDFQWSALGVMLRPHSLALLGFGAAYGMIGWGIEANLPLFYDTLHFSQGDVGKFGAIRYLGRATGALLLPIAARRIGQGWRLAIGIVALTATSSAQALVLDDWSAGPLAFAFGMANGWNDALFCVLAMEASDPRMAASTFALFMAVSNLSVAGDALFAEALALAHRNYRLVLACTGALAVGLFVFLPSLSREPKSNHDEL
jgi:MFS transporter, PAT family, beta-lactamase induction signal transducer AmpG